MDWDENTINKAKRKVLRLNREQLIEKYPAAYNRDRQSYHPHDLYVLQMEALNAELDCCGVEAIEDNNENYWDYLNTGDTYTLTVIRNPYTKQFLVTSWGDIIETREEFQQEAI